ncbi:flavodoxin family protein [Yoonia maritima]|uniref:flavodoxin family protein n=1 Tax=Yoonia maritima TaxID=1435347 RepID=UPI000D111A54|nr:flavodoxin family protein [Yoonia maritima]
MTKQAKIGIVYHSGYGHTKVQAESILAGVSSVDGVHGQLIEAEAAAANLDPLDDLDGLVFGSPTYMGTISAGFKGFMDASSAKWMEGAWKNKIAGGFTNSSSQVGDKTGTLQAMSVFAAQHGMIWVGLDLPPGNNSSLGSDENLNRMGASLGAMAQSMADQGPDETPTKSDKDTAHYYGSRIAEATLRWMN